MRCLFTAFLVDVRMVMGGKGGFVIIFKCESDSFLYPNVGHSIGFMCTKCGVEVYLFPRHDFKVPYNHLILSNDLFVCTLPLLIFPMPM